MRARDVQTGALGVIRIFYNMFSTVRKLDPPSATKTIHLRLITMRASHFCEKARWALDLLDDDEKSPYWYTEDTHPTGLHAFETVKASNDKASITPIVVMGDEVFIKSNAIVQKFCPQLYPSDKVREMEIDMGNRLGAPIRVFFYHYLLQDEYWPALKSMNVKDCSSIEAFFFGKMKGDLFPILRNGMKINDDTAALSRGLVVGLFEEYSQILDKQDYLAGDKFTAADLTFAALSAFCIAPPEISNFPCANEDLPPQVVQLGNELRETKAGKHVLKMYATHRFTTPGKTKVTVKTAPRNRFCW